MPDFFTIYFNDASQKYEAVNGPNENKTFTAVDGTEACGAACLQIDLNGKYVAFNVDGPNGATYRTFFDEPNSNLIFSAKDVGLDGNDIRIRYVVAGDSTALSVDVTDTDITVNLATDGDGIPTSTGDDILAAVEADAPADALVDVVHEERSDGTGVVPDGFSFRNLEYGSSGAAIAVIVEQIESTSTTPTTF